MLSVILANIGYLWTALGLTAIVLCFQTKQIMSALTIFFTIIPAWVQSVWYDPMTMLGTHLIILAVAGFWMNNQLTSRMLVSLYLMVTADGLAVCYELWMGSNPWVLFVWQSIINLVFAYMCVTTARWCWPWIRSGREKELAHDSQFLARMRKNMQS